MAELPRGDFSVRELDIDAALYAKIEQTIKHVLEHVLNMTLRHELNHNLTLDHRLTLSGSVNVNVTVGGGTPEPEEQLVYDGGNAGTTDAEYEANRDRWLDGGFAAETQRGIVEGGGA